MLVVTPSSNEYPIGFTVPIWMSSHHEINWKDSSFEKANSYSISNGSDNQPL